MYSQEASTSQTSQRQSSYQVRLGFENKGGNHQAQAQDSREPSFKEILAALSARQLRIDQYVTVMSQRLSKLEVQVRQLAKQL